MKAMLALFLCFSSIATLAEPIVIAHRGASGYLPEHTLEAATLAFALGSDYIEQDLVLSKDGVVMVLHDIHLETVTNVEAVFPDRARPDGRYYVIDFTLAELKQLTVHERHNRQGEPVFPDRYQGSGGYTIATFSEQIELIHNLNRQFQKQVGLYPEIKAPAWHRQQGYDISQIVVATLRQHDLDTAGARVYLQCFDFEEVKRLKSDFDLKIPLIQLIGYRSATTDYAYLQSSEGIAELKQYVVGVGPSIPHIINLSKGQVGPTKFMRGLNDSGLEVHPYTHRADLLPEGVNSEQVLQAVFGVGASGLFTDFPDQVKRYLERKQP